MAGKWNKISLGEVLTFQRGFDITKAEQKNGSYPVFSSSGYKSNHSEYKVRGPGVIIGRKGTLGTVFYSKTNFWPHDTTLWVRDFHNNEPKFAYYFLQTMGFERLDAGASNPTLNRNHIHTLKIKWPPLPTQHKIAAILSAYDDLIENNTRRIKILEEMAQNLYREWFVKFRFPGHEHAQFVDSPLGRIPEGWEVMELRNIVVLCRNGVQPKEYPEEIFEYFSFPAYDSGKLPAIEKGSEIKSSKYLVPQDCVLVPKLNPHISRVWLPKPKNNLRSIASTEYLILEPKRGSSAYYYVFFSRPEMIEKLAGRADGTSTSHKRLKPVDFLDQLVVMPPDSITDSFDLQIIPMMDIIDTLINTNTTLRTTRDLLLPKLISGGVDVSEIDITIPVEVKT
ncbi:MULTISPECIES: restriction endonuclease subunit S [Methanocalculus]|uniref:restriction endonuclease subunit S n=1 Tax=Methanocalculus TaxID=71151 RepID=UPI0020A0C245|nr:type I restriction enzyme S subunit [Methanocalculus sp. AMF5]